MLIKGELVLVQEEDRELYNTFPSPFKNLFDQCKASMKDLRKWFSNGKTFDPNFFLSLSPYFQGLYKLNPEYAILGVTKGEIKLVNDNLCTGHSDKPVKSENDILGSTSVFTLVEHLKNHSYHEFIQEELLTVEEDLSRNSNEDDDLKLHAYLTNKKGYYIHKLEHFPEPIQMKTLL